MTCDAEGEAFVGVAVAVEGLAVVEADAAGDDASEGVVMTLDADGATALPQPMTTTMAATMAATDRISG